MPYDAAFFKQYEHYLKEPSVRRSHDLVLDYFGSQVPREVVDLGAGCCEYFDYGSWGSYTAVDLTESRPELKSYGPNFKFVQSDYSNLNALPGAPDVFVSLFSIEAVVSQYEAYNLYATWFQANKTLKAALVSGFYYKSKVNQEMVGEAGGIVSYQTPPTDFGDFSIPGVREDRILTLTPSTLFGQDVVEVWKILTRVK